MILVDSCKVNYQILLITCLKLITKIVCKTCMERKNIKSECEFIKFKNNILNCRCKECKGKCNKSIDGLIEKFPSIYQFWDGDLNKFVLLLRKGVYPDECMDSWEKCDEISLPPKEDFYSELTLKDITDNDYIVLKKYGMYLK